MYDAILQAIEEKQLAQAANLLRQWQRAHPSDPWLGLALGRYWEAQGDGQRAQTIYRKLLQQVTNTRLLSLARAGLQRTTQSQSLSPEGQGQRAEVSTGSTQPGVLVLMTVPEPQRLVAARALAQVMDIDVYTARLRLSSQHWRLYRVGPLGELEHRCQALNHRGVPCGCVALEQITQITVWPVVAVESFEPQLRLICQGHSGRQDSFTLSWEEVQRGVVGQVPIYESVVDLGPWGKLQRRQTTQDYAEIMDWHLGDRGIVRFCDRTYHHQGSAMVPTLAPHYPSLGGQAIAWKALQRYCQEQGAITLLRDFSGFGLAALDFMDLIPDLGPTIDMGRDQPSAWDKAFQLYSGLRFLLPIKP